jgi:S-adenosylmethionine-diacylglycerol 3-amino-3-carboxypropyl transferase
LTALDPATNPYLQWVLTGTHTTAMPFALRPENFDAIRRHLDRLEWSSASIEEYLAAHGQLRFDRFNLSDIFEYMSPENHHAMLERLIAASHRGARLAYWNMLAPRSRPEALADRLRPLDDLAEQLFAQDKAWFYSRFVVEEAT